MPIKREEANDVVQYLIPQLEELGIPRANFKVDVTIESSGNKRGDVWLSTVSQQQPEFETNIIALIEAKHKNSTIGDMEWRDAMKQGKEKSVSHNLDYYVVTNNRSDFRFYNSHTDEEIYLDGKVITKLVPLAVLKKIRTQVSNENSYVIDKASREITPLSETKFRATLSRLAEIYRSAGLQKGDDRIDPTVSFVVIKYISEKEGEERSLNKVIKLWDDYRQLALGQEVGDLKIEFEKMVHLIWGESEYQDNIYSDFKNLIVFPSRLRDVHFKKIYKELDEYHFHGANFDLFGSIYEGFASQTKKKEFGEFYTRRHITGVTARLLLRNETNPRELSICDPACGTGGFLTEAYKALITNYSLSGTLNSSVSRKLRSDIFWGFDNDPKSVARTKLNMFLVGDGHTHMYENDSLGSWNESTGWKENSFDYILANPPMGQYDGDSSIDYYDFTNERRYELLFMEKMIAATKPGGNLAIVINDGSLEAPTRERFRRKVLEACEVHAIISLTKFAFAPYTKEKTYVMFLQKKQEDRVGEMQTFPIWHYILDYDGYANSDKRFRTKYHDDLPELEELFSGAVKTAKYFDSNSAYYKSHKGYYGRKVNEREKSEGLFGSKCGFVPIGDVNEENFFNLLSEFHLRNFSVDEKQLEHIQSEFKQILGSLEDALNSK